MTTRRHRFLLGLTVSALAIAVPSPSSAEVDCVDPTVNALISAEAAVSRPAINSPAEYGLSTVYSQAEQATYPQYVYAEAGPQFAGVFEALAPAGSPPPPRAFAAYPSEDIPDESTLDWGGVSHAAVTATSASSSSSGGRELGAGGATAENARSWVATTVECDVITVVAGWSASNVVLAPGVTAEQVGERLTLVVAPQGSSADVEVTIVGVEGAETPTVEGRPLDPFTDPIRENNGPTIEVGEPRAESSPEGAEAKGGGFNFLFLDPEAGQGAGYRFGSLEAKVEVLGGINAATPPRVDVAPIVDTPAVAAPPPVRRPTAPVRSVSGTPPPPSETALEIERTAVTDVVFSSVTVTTTNWFPLFAFLALVLATGSTYGAARLGRTRFPTLDWLLVRTDRRALRFLAVYLRW